MACDNLDFEDVDSLWVLPSTEVLTRTTFRYARNGLQKPPTHPVNAQERNPLLDTLETRSITENTKEKDPGPPDEKRNERRIGPTASDPEESQKYTKNDYIKSLMAIPSSIQTYRYQPHHHSNTRNTFPTNASYRNRYVRMNKERTFSWRQSRQPFFGVDRIPVTPVSPQLKFHSWNHRGSYDNFIRCGTSSSSGLPARRQPPRYVNLRHIKVKIEPGATRDPRSYSYNCSNAISHQQQARKTQKPFEKGSSMTMLSTRLQFIQRLKKNPKATYEPNK